MRSRSDLPVRIATWLVLTLCAATLVAMAVPHLVSRSCQACIAKNEADIATLRGLIDQFQVDTGRYPTEAEGLGALLHGPPHTPSWKGPYLEQLPHDTWGRPYLYQTDSHTFTVLSYGRDGEPGGDGDNADITSSD